MSLFLSEYIPRNVVLVKTVCPSRNGPNVRPELGMTIKDRQALIELVMKSVHHGETLVPPLSQYGVQSGVNEEPREAHTASWSSASTCQWVDALFLRFPFARSGSYVNRLGLIFLPSVWLGGCRLGGVWVLLGWWVRGWLWGGGWGVGGSLSWWLVVVCVCVYFDWSHVFVGQQ